MSEPTTEAGKRLVNHIRLFDVVDNYRGWADTETAQVEAEARAAVLAELRTAVKGLDLDALNPEINRREILALIDGLAKPESKVQGEPEPFCIEGHPEYVPGCSMCEWRRFVAAVMRRLPSPSDELRAEIRAEVEADNETRIESAAAARVARETARFTRISEQVEAFQAALGIDITKSHNGFDQPDPQRMAAAVRFVYAELGKWDTSAEAMRHTANTLDATVTRLTGLAEHLRTGAAAIDFKEPA